MSAFRIRRIYQESDGGYRVLVDRLWPRGVSKDAAHLDEWLKEVAPSPRLRRDFNHRAENFADFKDAYWRELEAVPEAQAAVARLRALANAESDIVLLYGARDEQINHAFVLREFLKSKG